MNRRRFLVAALGLAAASVGIPAYAQHRNGHKTGPSPPPTTAAVYPAVDLYPNLTLYPKG